MFRRCNFLLDDGGDGVADFAICGAAAKQIAEIVIVLAEQAGAEFPVGGEAQTRARAAKWLRDRSDQADFAASPSYPQNWSPLAPGAPDSRIIAGLSAGVTYYIALEAA